jgi:malate dehydrogenase
MIPCSALLDGEYGIEGLSIGVPCIIGKNGIEKIVEVSLSESEKNKLKESADGVSKTNMLLD